MKAKAICSTANSHHLCIVLSFILFGSCNPPKADFEADNTSPQIGDPVILRDLSENDPDTWEWDLDPAHFEYLQGTGSASQDPVVQFNEAGSYTVTLSVSNQDGSDTETKEDYINVLNDHTPTVKVYSPGLVNNLLEDNPERDVKVYLPPDYFENTSRHYPVIYLLHGYTGDHNTLYVGIENVVINIETSLNSLIGDGTIGPMIVVTPNSYNRFLGSKYANSSTAGQWEDFITQDVVQYIDAHFRTLPAPESRGIGGQSMGGYGAIKLAMKHPELFSVLYAQSASDLDFESIFFGLEKEDLVTASQLVSFTRSDLWVYGAGVGACVASAPAFAPNPDAPPFYGDFPVTANGDKIETTWQRWLEHDPMTMLPTYKENLKQLNAILFDCGRSDEFFSSNSRFSQALTEQGVNHTFEEYAGGHIEKVGDRLETIGFPFFSQHLEHE